MNKLKSEEITKNIFLHTFKENKFKTNLINFYFKRPLNKEEVTYNAILPMVLQRGTNVYKTSKDLVKKLEHLYGAHISGGVTKKGERQIIRFSMSIANENYVDDSNVLYEGLELLNDIITNPILNNGVFLNDYVNQEKENLKNKIKGRSNDKMKYAVDKCVEIMCENENYGIYEYGNIHDLQKITSESLYNHYRKVINNSELDVVVVGNTDHDKIKEILLEILDINISNPTSTEYRIEEVIRTKIKEVEDEMEVNQGKLTLGYRTNIPYYDNLYPALMVYSNVLGGGANCKLFRKVREEYSLCYYIFSRLEKYKSLMLISSGIEMENFNKAKDVIKKQLIEIEKGNITDKEMDYAKKNIVNSIKQLKDTPHDLAEYIYGQIISKSIEPLEKLIDRIESIKTEQVIEVSKNIKLDTIYFITNKR